MLLSEELEADAIWVRRIFSCSIKYSGLHVAWEALKCLFSCDDHDHRGAKCEAICAAQVMNNGLSHAESLDTAHIMPMVQDALDSVAFVTGPADTEWGSVRAAMGHPKPWKLPYFAIGNEVPAGLHIA